MMLATGLALVLAALPFGSTQFINNNWRIKIYEYGTEKCGDDAIHPKGVELSAGTCKNLSAGSVSAHYSGEPGKHKYNGWLEELNHGNVECGLELFDTSDCPQGTSVNILLPNSLHDCAYIDGKPILSVRFYCGLAFPPHTSHVEGTYTWTSWTTVGPTPIGYEHKTVLTTISTYPTSGVVNPAHTLGEFAARDAFPSQSAAAVKDRNDATASREKYPGLVGMWLMHPWTNQWRCVACWQRHHGKKFRCEQKTDVFAACGTHPSDLSTPPETVTELVAAIPPSGSKVPLQERGPKRYVIMKDPYSDNAVCARAEYHQHDGGHPKGSLEINGPKDMKKCDHNKAAAIAFKNPATVTETISSTTTATPSTKYITTIKSAAHQAPSDRGL